MKHFLVEAGTVVWELMVGAVVFIGIPAFVILLIYTASNS